MYPEKRSGSTDIKERRGKTTTVKECEFRVVLIAHKEVCGSLELPHGSTPLPLSLSHT